MNTSTQGHDSLKERKKFHKEKKEVNFHTKNPKPGGSWLKLLGFCPLRKEKCIFP
jgi:hypothetical protein